MQIAGGGGEMQGNAMVCDVERNVLSVSLLLESPGKNGKANRYVRESESNQLTSKTFDMSRRDNRPGLVRYEK